VGETNSCWFARDRRCSFSYGSQVGAPASACREDGSAGARGRGYGLSLLDYREAVIQSPGASRRGHGDIPGSGCGISSNGDVGGYLGGAVHRVTVDGYTGTEADGTGSGEVGAGDDG